MTNDQVFGAYIVQVNSTTYTVVITSYNVVSSGAIRGVASYDGNEWLSPSTTNYAVDLRINIPISSFPDDDTEYTLSLKIRSSGGDSTHGYDLTFRTPSSSVASITLNEETYSGTTVTYTWTVGSGDLDGFQIKTNSALPSWTNLSATARSYQFTGSGNARFVIRATHGDSFGTPSFNPWNVTAFQPPNPPASVSVSESGGVVTVAWTAPVGGTTATGYGVRSSEQSTYTSLPITTTSQQYSGLRAGRTYTFFVRATNANGNSTPRSREYTLDGVPYEKPTDVVAVGYVTTADLSWTAPTDTPVDDYEIRYRKTGESWEEWTPTGSTDTSHRVSGLDENSSYQFQVRGVNSFGGGTASDTASATTTITAWEEVIVFDDVSDLTDDTYKSIMVTHDRIFLTRDTNSNDFGLEAFTHAGDAVSADDREFGIYTNGRLEAVMPFGKNRIIGVYGNAAEGIGGRSVVIRDFAENQGVFGAFEPHDGDNTETLKDIKSVTVLPTGLLISDGGASGLSGATTEEGIYFIPFDAFLDSLVSNTEDTRPSYDSVNVNSVTQNSLVSAVRNIVFIGTGESGAFQAYTESGAFLTYLPERNISPPERHDSEDHKDITAYGRHLYLLTSKRILRADITKTVAPKPKQTIHPIFAKNGETIDLTQLVEGYESIAWQSGFTNPTYLSINNSYELVIASDAVSADTETLLKFTATNDAGSTNFEFYLVIIADAAPVWEDVSAGIPLPTDRDFDLFTICNGASSFAWKSGFTVPSDVSLVDNKLSFISTPTTSQVSVSITATAQNGMTADIDFDLIVVRNTQDVEYSDTLRYRLEVAGIDITQDLIIGEEDEDGIASIFNVTESSDDIRVNSRTVSDCELTLKNDDYKYSRYKPNNFWDTNSIPLDGLLSEVVLYADALVDNEWVPDVLFTGIVLELNDFVDGRIVLTAADESYRLLRASAREVGIDKTVRLIREEEQSEAYEGIYKPETTMLPIIPSLDNTAVSGGTALTIKRTQNASEGVVKDNSAYLSVADLRTQGGELDDDVLLTYTTNYGNRKIESVIRDLARSAGIYNTLTAFSEIETDDAFFKTLDSPAFRSERGRITVLPTSWIVDTINDKVYILLSNDEPHIKASLVEYDLDTDRYFTLYEFPAELDCLQLATEDFDTFYISATEAGYKDSSQSLTLKTDEDVLERYDATVESNSKIMRYAVSTDTLTENFVAKTDTNPIQNALHYYVGFSNKHTTHEYESLVSHNRGSFAFYDGELYYRFAKSSGFGVAKVASDGTTTALLTEAYDDYYNGLNFAFAIDASNGDVYLGYVEGGDFDEDTTLTIKKRTDAGVETTLYTHSASLSDLDDLEDTGGAYSGVHELFYHDDDLFAVVAIQKVREIDDTKYRSNALTAGAVLYRINTTGTSDRTVLKRYPFVHYSCRSLIDYNDEVYAFENLTESYEFRPIDSRKDTYNESLGYNLLPDENGSLIKVDISDTLAYSILDLGNIWYETSGYRGVKTNALIIDGELNIIAGYGRISQLLKLNSEASRRDNFIHIAYSNKLRYFLSEADVDSNSIFDALSDIALKTKAFFSMKQGLIQIEESDVIEGELDGLISTTLNYTQLNARSFPDAGHILVNNAEIIKYDNRVLTSLENLERGVLGTDIESHPDASRIVYLDNIIDARSIDNPYEDIRIGLDIERLYNTVKSPDDLTEVRDAALVRSQGERAFSLDLGLDRHNVSWIDVVNNKYLDDLKELRYLVEITLKPSNYIKLTNVISFYYAGAILLPVKVVAINYTAENTILTGRSV